ncbi:MAG: hypothetical protein WCJ55_18400 [Chloroflexales bacterium]
MSGGQGSPGLRARPAADDARWRRAGGPGRARGGAFWARITRVLNAIPETIQGLGRSITREVDRVVTIDAELARLADWDGQRLYDAAVAELALITSSFAIDEDRSHVDRRDQPHVEDMSDERSDLEIIIDLLEAEGDGPEVGLMPICIPPMPASMSLVSAEVERLAKRSRPALPDVPPLPAAERRRRPAIPAAHGEAFQQMRMF